MSVATFDARAAVLRERAGAFSIESVSMTLPRHDEVVVRIVGAGICHTDLGARDGKYITPLPVILGHEGSGVIERIGDQVRDLAVGDHVVLAFSSCGGCANCIGGLPAYCDAAYPLNFLAQRADGTCATSDADGRFIYDQFFGQSSLRSHAIVNARNVVRVHSALPLAALGPLGCGISTGAGAVLNALQVRPGSRIAIFGTGAVGLSAVMAARIAGATTIVALDVVASRLELALELGATHAVDSGKRDAVAAVRDITRGGADYSLDCTGIPRVLRAAHAALRTRGRCGLIGAAAAGTMVDFDMMELLNGGRSIVGIIEGDSNPPLFIPQLLEHNAQGRFPFEKLISYYPFASLAEAVHDAEKGDTVKPVLTFS